MNPRTCPLDHQLGRYSNGVLPEAEAETINSHLEVCATCLDKLDNLSSHPDRFVAALRSPGATSSEFHPALIRALAAAVGPSTFPVIEGSHTLQPGSSLSDYRILEELGRGGMGRVYRALHPRLGQEVALKVLRPGIDSVPILARFEAERQALALMDHPHIARVLDGGVTEDSRPFFVMELVRGVAITRYADENQLDLRWRLELFALVCHAVQHAHQKGIIHRDLKPSNVLVAEYDGKPAPKVIDFGVAKALEPRTTMRTEVGMLVGTPEYMSPEQADLTAIDIDTRSDVYALGVMLYELLTGDTPFARTRMRETPILEVLRIIREEEPAPPSQQLASPQSEQGNTAQRSKLAKEVRGELDWIVTKCLEKDRSRRYETASALAEDVRRFLNDEPVLAGPPSRVYQLKKFVSRNRVSVSAAASVLVVLLAGVAVSTALAVWAIRAEKDAKADRDKALAAGERADQEAAIAQEVSDFLQMDVLRQADTTVQADRQQVPKPNLTVREALDRAAARIGERFRDKPLVESAIRLAIGDAYRGVGEARLALEHLERSVELRRTVLGPASTQTRRSMESLTAAYYSARRYKDALAVQKQLVELSKSDGPIDTASLTLDWDHLARLFHEGSAEALDLQKEMLEIEKTALGPDHPEVFVSMRSLAIGYRYAGRLPECITISEAALRQMLSTLGPNHPKTLQCMKDLAGDYRTAGRVSESIQLHEQAMPLLKAVRGSEHPDTINNALRLALAYLDVDRIAEAVVLYEEVVRIRKAKFGPDHPWTARAMVDLAAAYERAKEYTKAEALDRELLAIERERYGSDHPEVGVILCRLGRNLIMQSKYVDAEPLLREALAICEKGGEHWQTAHTRSLLGTALLGLQKYADAEPLLLKAYEGLTQHQQQIPLSRRDQLSTEAVAPIVQLYNAWGKTAEAAQWRGKLPAARAPSCVSQ